MCNLINCFAQDTAYAAIIAALIGLIGALAAVTGAIFVGLRQTSIIERQNEAQRSLAAEAHSMEQLRFRSDLFDRRMTIYDGAREYLAFVIDKYVHGFADEGLSDEELIALEAQKRREFATAIRLADFLCPNPLRLTLFSISRTVTDLRSVKRKIARLQNQPSRTEAEEKVFAKLIDQETEIETKLSAFETELPSQFRPIMKLTPDEPAQSGAAAANK